jgi:cob(I)alamin adenosyltransferase
MPKVKIYTKTGDRGTSSLFNQERRKKDDAVFHALGTVDELNAHIGLAYEHALIAGLNSLAEQLSMIQSTLLDLGSHIATPKTSEYSDEKHLERAKFNASDLLTTIEQSIDTMDTELPPLRNFILPVRFSCFLTQLTDAFSGTNSSSDVCHDSTLTLFKIIDFLSIFFISLVV